jgi:branched-chain amino acid transport system permease protein
VNQANTLVRHSTIWRIVGVVAVVVALAFLLMQPANAADVAPAPVEAGNNRLLQNIVNGISFGLLLALASVGLSLIFGTTGLSNFAHGEQVTLGAATAYVGVTAGLNLWLAAVLAVVVGGVSGWLQDLVLWSKLRKRGVGTMQQMIVSIGLALVLVNLLQIWVGGERFRLTTTVDKPWDLGPVSLGATTLYSMILCVVVLGGVGYFLQRTRLGRATRAVSDNPALASATGISVNRVIRIVWILACALAALAGILLAFYQNTGDFQSGARILLLMFAAVTLGGLGHPFGALVGSLLIGLVSEVSTVYLPTSDLKYAVVMAVLIIMLLVRPQGILGRKERVG